MVSKGYWDMSIVWNITVLTVLTIIAHFSGFEIGTRDIE